MPKHPKNQGFRVTIIEGFYYNEIQRISGIFEVRDTIFSGSHLPHTSNERHFESISRRAEMYLSVFLCEQG